MYIFLFIILNYFKKGYLACTLLLNETHELLTLITNSIKRDLKSRNPNVQCLALTAIANVGGKEFAESLSQDVQKLLISGDTKNIVRKKSALTKSYYYIRKINFIKKCKRSIHLVKF